MNKQGIFSGRVETPLTDKGKIQAIQAGDLLTGMHIDCIVSSPMGRTMETAELIAKRIGYSKDKILTNELFTERDFGPLEQTLYQPDLGDIEGVEEITALIARARQGLLFLESLPVQTILLVSHGAIGRALRHSIDPSIPFRPSTGFGNGTIVKLL
jgi:broad specificity phosphatase PhoE